MSLRIGIGLGIPFNHGAGVDWDAYWATHYISALTVLTTSSTTQTVTATIEGGAGPDGVSFEYSIDGGASWSAGITDADGVLNATGLTTGEIYHWRARLYKGSNYGGYSMIDYAAMFHPNLIAGWKMDEEVDHDDYWGNTLGDYAFLDFVNSHSAQYFNGKTYIVYAGNSDDPYITAYTHATGLWATPVKVGTNPLVNGDGHGSPTILVDSDGYIHCFFGSHTSALIYSKSNNPEDISAWTSMTSPDAGLCTYPSLMQFSDGTIYLFYRLGINATPAQWGYRTSVNGGVNWSAYTQISVGSALGDGFAYGFIKKGVGDFIHCVLITGISTANRKDIYYMYYDGTWRNIEGDTVTIPLQISDMTALAYDSGDEWIPSVTYHWDSSNNPYLLFTEGHTADPVNGGAGTFNYKFLRHNGTAWILSSLGVSGNNWRDFATAIERVSENNFDAYVITGGLVDAISGNIEKWSSADNGVTWALSQLIREGQYLDPCIVYNYNSEAKLLFAEFNNTSIAWTGKGYLWGDSGFVINHGYVLTPEIKGNYPLTLYNTPALEAGVFGNAFVFVGTSFEYLAHDDRDIFSFAGGSPDKPFTFTLWLKVANTAVLKIVFAKVNDLQSEYQFYINANTLVVNLTELTGGDNLTASAPFTETGSFVFLCVTYDGGGLEAGLKIYKNCVESQTVQTQGGTYTGMTNGKSALTIARRAIAATPYYLTGSVDNFKIFNKVLSPAEMAAEMANTL